MLLSEEEGNSDEDGTSRQETHQDSVRLEDLGLGSITDRLGDTESNSGADDLERGTGNVEQVVELHTSGMKPNGESRGATYLCSLIRDKLVVNLGAAMRSDRGQ